MSQALPLRRTLIAALLSLPLLASADDIRPIEWVVGYAAGGGADVVARTVAEQMAKALSGQTFIVNNKPGAATNIAADYVAKSRDPLHMMLTADFATLAANPSLFSELPYNAEKRTGLKLNHVPGAAPAVQDLLGGQIPFALMDSASVQQYLVGGGKLRAIGVASPKRLPTMNEIPTLAEQGLADFEAHAWQGLVVPAATPQQMATYARSERERWGKLIRANNIKLD